jgi:hypothetical protein
MGAVRSTGWEVDLTTRCWQEDVRWREGKKSAIQTADPPSISLLQHHTTTGGTHWGARGIWATRSAALPARKLTTPLCLAPRHTVPLHFCVGQHICECSLSPHTRCGTVKQMLTQIANATIMKTVDREGISAYTHHRHRQHHPPTGLHNRNNATRDFDKLSEKTACLWLVWSDERPKGQALLGPTAAQRRFRSIQHARQHRRNAAPISPGLCSWRRCAGHTHTHNTLARRLGWHHTTRTEPHDFKV